MPEIQFTPTRSEPPPRAIPFFRPPARWRRRLCAGRRGGSPRHAQSAPLADGVEADPPMTPDLASPLVEDGAGTASSSSSRAGPSGHKILALRLGCDVQPGVGRPVSSPPPSSGPQGKEAACAAGSGPGNRGNRIGPCAARRLSSARPSRRPGGARSGHSGRWRRVRRRCRRASLRPSRSPNSHRAVAADGGIAGSANGIHAGCTPALRGGRPR